MSAYPCIYLLIWTNKAAAGKYSFTGSRFTCISLSSLKGITTVSQDPDIFY